MAPEQPPAELNPSSKYSLENKIKSKQSHKQKTHKTKQTQKQN